MDEYLCRTTFLYCGGRNGTFDKPFGPVSYTHLRAHETDSYLVCRLLLEKKKKKNKNKKKKKKTNTTIHE